MGTVIKRFFLVVFLISTVFIYLLLINTNLWTVHQRGLDIRVDSEGDQQENDEQIENLQLGFSSITHNCMNDYDFHIVNQSAVRINKSHPIEFLPNLRNPCWFERFDWQDVDNISESPYTKLKTNRHIDEVLSEVATVLVDRLNTPSNNRNIRLRCLPYFILIGQVKCGTTDLFRRLASHPQIESGMLKEPDWWTRSAPGANGKFAHPTALPFDAFVDLNGLAAVHIEKQLATQHCRRLNDSKSKTRFSIIADGSVATLSDQPWRKKSSVFGQIYELASNTPSYLKWIVPKSKIIVILRDPVSRLFSDYLFFDKSGLVSQSDFHSRVVKTLKTFNNCKNKHGERYCVNQREITKRFRVGLHRGLYSVLLKDWFIVYPRKNILVLKTEDYGKDEMTVLRQVFEFLDLDSLIEEQEAAIMQGKIRNEGRTKIGEMWNSTRNILQQFYQPYNEELAQLLKDQRFLWK